MSREKDLKRLEEAESEMLKHWQHALKYLRRDLANIWLDTVSKEDFDAIEEEAKYIIFALEKLKAHYESRTWGDYESIIRSLKRLIKYLKHPEARKSWVAARHAELKDIVVKLHDIVTFGHKAGLVFHGGVINKDEIAGKEIVLHNVAYVAPTIGGAYHGIKKPGLGKTRFLLEIRYYNPLLFVDHQSQNEGRIRQEAFWIGRELRLRKISDKEKSEHWGTYRYIVAEPIDNSERSLTKSEYQQALSSWEAKYKKRAIPDEMSAEEFNYFIEIVESLKK